MEHSSRRTVPFVAGLLALLLAAPAATAGDGDGGPAADPASRVRVTLDGGKTFDGTLSPTRTGFLIATADGLEVYITEDEIVSVVPLDPAGRPVRPGYPALASAEPASPAAGADGVGSAAPAPAPAPAEPARTELAPAEAAPSRLAIAAPVPLAAGPAGPSLASESRPASAEGSEPRPAAVAADAGAARAPAAMTAPPGPESGSAAPALSPTPGPRAQESLPEVALAPGVPRGRGMRGAEASPPGPLALGPLRPSGSHEPDAAEPRVERRPPPAVPSPPDRIEPPASRREAVLADHALGPGLSRWEWLEPDRPPRADLIAVGALRLRGVHAPFARIETDGAGAGGRSDPAAASPRAAPGAAADRVRGARAPRSRPARRSERQPITDALLAPARPTPWLAGLAGPTPPRLAPRLPPVQ